MTADSIYNNYEVEITNKFIPIQFIHSDTVPSSYCLIESPFRSSQLSSAVTFCSQEFPTFSDNDQIRKRYNCV